MGGLFVFSLCVEFIEFYETSHLIQIYISHPQTEQMSARVKKDRLIELIELFETYLGKQMPLSCDLAESW